MATKNPARKALTRAVNRAMAEGAPELVNEAPKKSTPKKKAIVPLTMDNLRSRLTKAEIAALAEHAEAQAIVNKINLVLSTCAATPDYFKYVQRVSKAFGPIGSVDVDELASIYADLTHATGVNPDGMTWKPYSDKRGNFRAYSKFMERYVVWTAKGSPGRARARRRGGSKMRHEPNAGILKFQDGTRIAGSLSSTSHMSRPRIRMTRESLSRRQAIPRISFRWRRGMSTRRPTTVKL